MKTVAMLRVKDGILFVEKWLENIGSLFDEIVVVDNGSTDGTFEILKVHPKVVLIERTEGFDEGRDKNMLYEMARKRNADWCLWLDVDEIFEEAFTREKLLKLISNKKVNRYFFRRFHFVDEEHYNSEWYWLKYCSSPDRVLWRDQKSGYFENIKFNNGLVKGIKGIATISHFRIKHLGYIYKDEVKKKIDNYRSIDPSLEKTYQSIQFNGEHKAKWFEFHEKPLRVLLLNYFLDLIWIFRFIPYKLKSAINLISRKIH